jgi:Uma2 family endonuclease
MSTALRSELPHHMTVADFLDWPGDGEGGRYQLIEGELCAMAPGATDTHGTIQSNLIIAVGRHLGDTNSPCRVVTEPAIIPRVRAGFNLRVPDLGVTCTPNLAGQIEMPDPVLLIEVLSPGNANDTRANVWAYASIPSVREILLVHSTQVAAELLRRGNDGAWPERATLIGATEVLRLESIGFAAPLMELYARTHLAQGAPG